MGNRWADYVTKIFNPPEAPLLHVYSGRYVASVGNELSVSLGVHDSQKGIEQTLEEIIVTPLLPPIEEIPPSVAVSDAVAAAVSRLFIDYHLLSLLEQHASSNRLHLTHGAKWGYAFVDAICERLVEEGYGINPKEVACLGRGKRIPHYRLPFQHPGNLSLPIPSRYAQPTIYGF